VTGTDACRAIEFGMFMGKHAGFQVIHRRKASFVKHHFEWLGQLRT